MPDLSKGSTGVWMLESSGEVECCLHSSIDGRCCRHFVKVREKLDGASDAFRSCLCYVDFVASVMFWSIADVPSIEAVGVPR